MWLQSPPSRCLPHVLVHDSVLATPERLLCSTLLLPQVLRAAKHAVARVKQLVASLDILQPAQEAADNEQGGESDQEAGGAQEKQPKNSSKAPSTPKRTPSPPLPLARTEQDYKEWADWAINTLAGIVEVWDKRVDPTAIAMGLLDEVGCWFQLAVQVHRITMVCCPGPLQLCLASVMPLLRLWRGAAAAVMVGCFYEWSTPVESCVRFDSCTHLYGSGSSIHSVRCGLHLGHKGHHQTNACVPQAPVHQAWVVTVVHSDWPVPQLLVAVCVGVVPQVIPNGDHLASVLVALLRTACNTAASKVDLTKKNCPHLVVDRFKG